MFKRENYNQSSREYAHSCRGNFKRKFERFFSEGSPFGNGNSANIPVNIAENDEFYQVQVYAAGREKDQFQVNITDNILTIKGKETEPEPGIKYIYIKNSN
ncbi:Hsp20/alpha crystallin family protein [Sphingobacterium daejeonense]|uniref:Hsp20/alpha crystallin family protein n=1 Tax=Sphingobacterium daejeonense TaxID=371142 RepID=UPI0010C535C7|nr:Hsp20/alpha crystallin family protein [Sphingobacterium daejeonense]VTQ00662.1 Uncharacterised protein [Sphingobacterium daejeonense]